MTTQEILQGVHDWTLQKVVYDVSEKNPTGGPNSDGKFTLEYILSNADTLIPTAVRKGGMSIKFVQSSDNKYVQARLMANYFTTDISKWQIVDDKPILESQNLINSGAVFEQGNFVNDITSSFTLIEDKCVTGNVGSGINEVTLIGCNVTSITKSNSAINGKLVIHGTFPDVSRHLQFINSSQLITRLIKLDVGTELSKEVIFEDNEIAVYVNSNDGLKVYSVKDVKSVVEEHSTQLDNVASNISTLNDVCVEEAAGTIYAEDADKVVVGSIGNSINVVSSPGNSAATILNGGDEYYKINGAFPDLSRNLTFVNSLGKITRTIKFPNGTTQYSIVFNRGESAVYVNHTGSLTVINGNTLKKEVEELAQNVKGSSVNNWEDKVVAFYGDSITDMNGGDFTYPYTINSQTGYGATGWSVRVADYFGFAKLKNRGIGGQSIAWGYKGGSVCFIDSNGVCVGRNDNSNYDDYTGDVPEGCTKSRGSFCSWLRITSMFPSSIKNEINAVVIMGGTNDSVGDTSFAWVVNDTTDPEWAASTEYSDYGGDYNISTMQGGIASMVMKMQAWMPNALIILCTPPNTRGVAGQKNSELVSDEYSKKDNTIKMAELLSTPLIDVFGTCCINGLNRDIYVTNNGQGDTIHPYDAVGKKMLARTFISGLIPILPRL